MRAGSRYVLNAPIVRRILLRAALFLVPASVLWTLLPLVATQRLGLGADGYGLLLGALGAGAGASARARGARSWLGAVAGALMLPRFRARLSANHMVGAASALYALVSVLIVIVPNPVLAVIALLPAGAAWIAVLSDINAELQLFLPAWVRARGLSVYQMVLFGAHGCRCSDMGGDCRTVWRESCIPDRRSGDGGRAGNHAVLALSRYRRHGSPDELVLA